MGTIVKTAEGHTLTFKFGDKATRTVNIDEFSAETRDRALVHGFSQVLGDSYAGAANEAKEEGTDVLDVALGRFDKRLEALKTGWSTRVAGGTPREAAIDLATLAEAIAQTRKKDATKVGKFLQGLREAKKHGEVRGWRDQPDVLPVYNKMLAKMGKGVEKKDDSVFDAVE